MGVHTCSPPAGPSQAVPRGLRPHHLAPCLSAMGHLLWGPGELHEARDYGPHCNWGLAMAQTQAVGSPGQCRGSQASPPLMEMGLMSEPGH